VDREKEIRLEAEKLGRIVGKKNKAYGDSTSKTVDIVKVFMQKYQNEDGTYTIPEELIEQITRQVRIIDKQCRLFNNPKQDLMEESPYLDIAGYGILGNLKEGDYANE
jgi:hypothetical protein